MKINSIQNHLSSINVIDRPQIMRLFFVPLVWGSFWHVQAIFSLLWFVPCQKVLTCKFTINQFLQGSASGIKKRDSFFEWQDGASGITKQRKVGTTIWSNLLQSGTTFIPKWGKKLLTVQIANERNRGNRFWQPTPLFTSNYLAKDTGERG